MKLSPATINRFVVKKDPAPYEDPLLNAHEVCRWLNIARSTLTRWMASGRIRYIKIGYVVRYRASDIRAFINEHEV